MPASETGEFASVPLPLYTLSPQGLWPTLVLRPLKDAVMRARCLLLPTGLSNPVETELAADQRDHRHAERVSGMPWKNDIRASQSRMLVLVRREIG